MTVLLVALGGAVGATVRYLVSDLFDRDFPAGTLLVNVAGSFALGLLLAIGAGSNVLALLGTGFCGALTTYSAFAVQTHALGVRRGAAYAALTLALGLGACFLGFWVGQA